MKVEFKEVVMIKLFMELGLRPVDITQLLPICKDTANRWRKKFSVIERLQNE